MEMNAEKEKVKRISRQQSLVHIMTDQKQLENLEYFNYLGSIITNYARCTGEIKSIIVMEKVALSMKENLYKQIGVKVKEETSELLHSEHSFLWC
jgi:hypothetical protein